MIDASNAAAGEEPSFTNYRDIFKGTLDYIFFRHEALLQRLAAEGQAGDANGDQLPGAEGQEGAPDGRGEVGEDGRGGGGGGFYLQAKTYGGARVLVNRCLSMISEGAARVPSSSTCLVFCLFSFLFSLPGPPPVV